MVIWLSTVTTATAQKPASESGDPAAAQAPAAPNTPPTSTTSPLSSTEKFHMAMRDSVLSPVMYGAAAAAGLSMATNSSRDYGQGGRGFARRYGDFIGTGIVYEISGTWISASLLHQDPRYYKSPKRGAGQRMTYALSRVLITRGDDGTTQMNTSNLIGTAVAAAASTAWHPNERHHGKRWTARLSTGLAFDGLEKLAKEFLRFGR